MMAISADGFIEQKVSRKVRGGNVVLLHDGGHVTFGMDRSKTVAAVNQLIARYRGEGFEFADIPAMMRSV